MHDAVLHEQKKKWKRKHKQGQCHVHRCEAGTSVCQYVWVQPCRRRSGVTEQADKQAAGLASAATRLSRHTTRLGAAYHSAHTRGTQWALSPTHHAPAAAAMRNIHTGTKGSGAGRGGAADLGGEHKPRGQRKQGCNGRSSDLLANYCRKFEGIVFYKIRNQEVVMDIFWGEATYYILIFDGKQFAKGFVFFFTLVIHCIISKYFFYWFLWSIIIIWPLVTITEPPEFLIKLLIHTQHVV